MTGCQGDPFSTSEVREIARQSSYLQNPWLSRDQLADPISVKQYNLQLKQLTGPVDFDEVGVSIFSQNNEDGILLGIFSKLGMPIKRCVEIGCDLTHSTIGIPEGNSINLIVNFGFDGLIIDVDAEKTSAIRHFFANALATKHFHVPAPSLKDSHQFSPNLVTARVYTVNIAILVIGIALTAVIVAAPIHAIYRNTHPLNEGRNFYRQAALELTRQWHNQFDVALVAVGGDEGLAFATAFYSPDHPAYEVSLVLPNNETLPLQTASKHGCSALLR